MHTKLHNVSLITVHVHSTYDGMLCFHRCLSVQGGTVSPSIIFPSHKYFHWSHVLSGGTPVTGPRSLPGGEYPTSRSQTGGGGVWDGIPPSQVRMGVPLARDRVPLDQVAMGYPPPGQGWGTVPPPPRVGYTITCYAVSGTPLAISRRRTFLWIHINLLRQQVQSFSKHFLIQ